MTLVAVFTGTYAEASILSFCSERVVTPAPQAARASAS